MMKQRSKNKRPDDLATKAPGDCSPIIDRYWRLADEFSSRIDRQLDVALPNPQNPDCLAGTELAAIMSNCSEISQSTSGLDRHQAMHDFRGHISIINNAIGLYELLGAQSDRRTVLEMVLRNLQKLAKVAGQLCDEPDDKLIPTDIASFLVKTCEKLELLLISHYSNGISPAHQS